MFARGCALVFAVFALAALAHEETKPRLLTVTGEGEVSVAPDRADVSLIVEASEKNLADAEKSVSDGVARLLKLCDSLDIARAQVRSAQLNVTPQYDDGTSKVFSNRPKIVGYVVSRQLDVDLRDLAKLGRLLQGALESGANRISGPSFGSSKKDEHQRAALALAAQDARANAETLAKAMDVKLGKLHALTASESSAMPQPMYAARMKVMGGQPEQGYEPGEIKFNASVSAEFDLP